MDIEQSGEQSENRPEPGSTEHLRPWQWKPGQSGNPKGRPKHKTLTELCREVLERETRGKVTDEILAEVIVKNALTGKFPFVKELWDRLDGKVSDKHEITGQESITLIVPAPRVLGEPAAPIQAPAGATVVPREEVPEQFRDGAVVYRNAAGEVVKAVIGIDPTAI
jgi:hypothetical protein